MRRYATLHNDRPRIVGAGLAPARLSSLRHHVETVILSQRDTPDTTPSIIPNMPRRVRKSMRLPSTAYTEPGRLFSITIATSPRAPVFADVPFGLECLRLLKDLRDKKGLRVYAYCLMPDHVHLLAAMASRASLSAAIGTWKSLCYRERHRRGNPTRFWQRSFFDRALRDDANVLDAAMYILGNPVRAELVRDFHDYPLCGSLEFEL